MISDEELHRILGQVPNADASQQRDFAAKLSKVAAKAEDDVLVLLGREAKHFVGWLHSDEDLTCAYSACILANVAFLEVGQNQVLHSGGVAMLMKLLKDSSKDPKVTLHAVAAIQNLTYKNAACCLVVLENNGEKQLKKLLHHASEDIQQFAAGALANLLLHQRTLEDDKEKNEQTAAGKRRGVLNKRAKQILKRREKEAVGEAVSTEPDQLAEAATLIQAHMRAALARKEVARLFARKATQKDRTKRYETFNFNQVRDEVDRNEIMVSAPQHSSHTKKPLLRGSSGVGVGVVPLGNLSPVEGVRRPTRLAPLEAKPTLSMDAAALPPIVNSARRPPAAVAAFPRLGRA